MEDILEIYGSKCPEKTVRLCFDERPCQLIEQVYTPMKMEAGKPMREDYEYNRNGTCSLLMAYDIDRGIRIGQVRNRRTKKDFAEVQDWIEQQYPEYDRIIMILDNLNTHNYGSFYENLPVDRASELRNKIEFHYTPKHGSWLNMVEIEFAALSKQCLDRRIGSQPELSKQIKAWMKQRNQDKTKISWSFTVASARDKMGSQYAKVVNKN